MYAQTWWKICIKDVKSLSEDTIHSENNETVENISQAQHSEHQEVKNVCVFCLRGPVKIGKKGKREYPLVSDKDALVKAAEKYHEYIGDTDVYKNLTGEEVLICHRSCPRKYIYSLHIFDDKPETEQCKRLRYYEEAFRYICSFIDNNIIKEKKFYFLSELNEYYMDCIQGQANADGITFNLTVSQKNLEKKLRKEYGRNVLKITVMHQMKIVGHRDCQIDEHTFKLLKEKHNIYKAAKKKRKQILDIKKN